jgi:5-methylcytosine-specific restriction enzyme A
MTVTTERLETLFKDFVQFIKATSNENFQAFATSKYIDDQENYKYEVYKEARNSLGNQWWKSEDIGTGRIQQYVSAAIKTRVEYNSQMVNNNLVDWRKKDDFSKRPRSRALETTLFNFYKSKIKDSDAFAQFVKEGLTYQFIAYLFFIKDSNRYLPISQERFDLIFELIGLPGFKTSNNASWENYNEFCGIIKQVRDFLKTKDQSTKLLDAHSFLWVLGKQMQEAKPAKLAKPNPIVLLEYKPEAIPLLETPIEVGRTNVSELTSLQWTEILQNKRITTDFDLSIFQTLYSFQGHSAYASQIALILGTTHPPLNLEIGRYAKRISESYQINFTARSTEKYKFWDLFFNGWDDGAKFVWQLRPEIVEALETTGLTGEEKFPNELSPDISEELIEGLKRTITVNSYERNTKARQLCVKHWKAICAVCSFDFEKTYGEIGRGFIHVHHVTPISTIGKSYQIDPVNDLIPVCPNCHAMIHTQEPPLKIDDLKSKLNQEPIGKIAKAPRTI